ncbi:hypothetical protein FOCC_FOCC002622, partial [Frankliniella occidentalis]
MEINQDHSHPPLGCPAAAAVWRCWQILGLGQRPGPLQTLCPGRDADLGLFQPRPHLGQRSLVALPLLEVRLHGAALLLGRGPHLRHLGAHGRHALPHLGCVRAGHELAQQLLGLGLHLLEHGGLLRELLLQGLRVAGALVGLHVRGLEAGEQSRGRGHRPGVHVAEPRLQLAPLGLQLFQVPHPLLRRLQGGLQPRLDLRHLLLQHGLGVGRRDGAQRRVQVAQPLEHGLGGLAQRLARGLLVAQLLGDAQRVAAPRHGAQLGVGARQQRGQGVALLAVALPGALRALEARQLVERGLVRLVPPRLQGRHVLVQEARRVRVPAQVLAALQHAHHGRPLAVQLAHGALLLAHQRAHRHQRLRTYRVLLLSALSDARKAVGEGRHVLLELLHAAAGLRVLVGRGLDALEHVEQHLHLAVQHRLVVRQAREEGLVAVELGLDLLAGAGRGALAQDRVGLVQPGGDLSAPSLQRLLLDQHLVVQRVHHGVHLLARQVLDQALEGLADALEQLLHALHLGLQLLQLLAVRLDALGRAQLQVQVGQHRLGAAQPALQALHAVVELAAKAEQVAGVHVLLHVAEHLVPARRQLGQRVAERARHALVAGRRQEAHRVHEQRQLVLPHAQVLEEVLALVLGQALQGVRRALQPVLQLLRERVVPPP